MKSGVSKIRNRVLARVFTELGLIEAWGSGYDRIVKACRLGGYPEPEWYEPGLVLQVVFRPHPAVNDSSGANVAANNPLNDPVNVPINVPINPRQQWLLDQLGAGIKVKAADLASHWGVSVKTARRDILILKAHSLIAFFGAQKTGHYRLVKP